MHPETIKILRSRIIPISITLNVSLPTTPVIVDDGAYTLDLAQLHAMWNAAHPETGLAECQYAIGTTPGASDLVGWEIQYGLNPLDSTDALLDADKDGAYSYDLTVCDALYCSDPDPVTVFASVPNVAPNADAGSDQDVLTGQYVSLNGSFSCMC